MSWNNNTIYRTCALSISATRFCFAMKNKNQRYLYFNLQYWDISRIMIHLFVDKYTSALDSTTSSSIMSGNELKNVGIIDNDKYIALIIHGELNNVWSELNNVGIRDNNKYASSIIWRAQ